MGASFLFREMTVLVSVAVFFQSIELIWLLARGQVEGVLAVRSLGSRLEAGSFVGRAVWEVLFSGWIFAGVQVLRIALAVLMAVRGAGSVASQLALLLTFYSSLRFGGSFNGGSDSMTLIALSGLVLGAYDPRAGLLWVGSLSILSYFVNGLRKGILRDWWSGAALEAFIRSSEVSIVPVQMVVVRARWFHRPASIAVILFQVLFPLFMFSKTAILFALGVGILFHFGNFVLFGLNRFFWIWVATYPAVAFVAEQIASRGANPL
ncbi:MAG: hypothetical protein EBX52_06830 [Proteobacteria bacterium]|nr:hypothetical protein [Pseudomonadota bacterium]